MNVIKVDEIDGFLINRRKPSKQFLAHDGDVNERRFILKYCLLFAAMDTPSSNFNCSLSIKSFRFEIVLLGRTLENILRDVVVSVFD